MKKLALLLAAMLVAMPLASCTAEDNTPDGTTTAATTTASTTTTAATTTKNPILDKLPETEGGDEGGDEKPADKSVTVGTAEELVSAIQSINNGDFPENTNITLSANIDLSGYTTCDQWEPIYRYSGTFDGAGYAIFNLNWNFTMANGGNTNMPVATDASSYVIESINDGLNGCYARGTVALLVLQLNGGTVKNLTVGDSSFTIHCSYNKNYQMFFGGVVGYMNGGTVTEITLSNVDITIPANVNYNQGLTGYAAPVVGRVSGNGAVTKCVVGSGCLVDASANVMFNTGKLVGVLEAEGSVDINGSSSEAECKVHENPTTDVLAYKGAGITLGGVAGDLVGTDLNA